MKKYYEFLDNENNFDDIEYNNIVQNFKKTLTDRNLNFSKDSTPELINKFNNPNYKKFKNKILEIINVRCKELNINNVLFSYNYNGKQIPLEIVETPTINGIKIMPFLTPNDLQIGDKLGNTRYSILPLTYFPVNKEAKNRLKIVNVGDEVYIGVYKKDMIFNGFNDKDSPKFAPIKK